MLFTGTDAVLECAFYDSSGDLGDFKRLAQLTQFTVDHNVETVTVTELGSANSFKVPTYSDWSVSATGSFDYAATGHSDLKPGTKLHIVILPETMEADRLRVYGPCIVESVNISTQAGAVSEFQVTFTGNGGVSLVNQYPKYTPTKPDGSAYVDGNGALYEPGTILDPYNNHAPWVWNQITVPPFTPYEDNGVDALVPVWPDGTPDASKTTLPAPTPPADA